MLTGWERRLKAWEEAHLIDAALAARIRDFEALSARSGSWRWPVILAWVFGGMLLCAGVLLFVAAHWDNLPPSGRFALVGIMVAAFHVSGALLRQRDDALGQVLHAVGTVALGGGIYLAGQIFNLQEHWPGAIMLWAAGAWLAWLLLRDRIQAVYCALLTPVWLAGEWSEATRNMAGGQLLASEGLCLLALVYLGARMAGREGPTRHDLAWIGGMSVIPLTFWVLFARNVWIDRGLTTIPTGLLLAGWALGYGGPLLLGFLLRARAGWMLIVAAIWVRLLGATASGISASSADFSWRKISTYVLCAVGSALMAGWGILESRRERVNLAVAGFGLTVICFYFDSVMDKLGRSVSLMSLGLLFLLGGYALARTRQRLMAKLAGGAP
ncbi:MAG TPA: DUF2157 domain-containing protein [Patescibacteria group bacterium]|nr:DUF2157 domain-containing protein [Patescibacteria group bacterium]